MKTIRSLVGIAIGVLVSAMNVHAAPYASGFTNVVSGGITNVEYWINAPLGAGTNVVITTYPSGNSATNNPAQAAQGTNTFVLSTNGTAGDTSYTVTIIQIGSGTPALEPIATANSANTQWGGGPDPRGMDVNCDPTNGPVFGTVYMANSASAAASSPYLARNKGLFPCHSDLSYAFGATSAGLGSSTFASSGSSGPFKLNVSRADGSVFVCDVSTAESTVWQFSPYLTTPVQVLADLGNTAGRSAGVHGLVDAVASSGSLANGNLVLYTMDEGLLAPATVNSTFGGLSGAIGVGASYYNSVLLYPGGSLASITAPNSVNNLDRYTIGSSIPGGGYANAPDLTICEGLNGLNAFTNSPGTIPATIDVAPDGKLFFASERANQGEDAPWLAIYDSTGATNLFCSATAFGAPGTDIIAAQVIAAGYDGGADFNGNLVRVSPDNKYVALGGYYGYIAIYKLTNGIPDTTTFNFIANGAVGSTSRGIAWDMADNVYQFYGQSSLGGVYIYDLGLTTTCVSSNDVTGLNGSFSLTVPNTTASVAATTPIAYQANNSYAIANSIAPEPAAVPAVFTITLNVPAPITTIANFTLSGTATNVSNYTISSAAPVTSSSVTIGPGTNSVTVLVTPTTTPAVGPTLSVIMSLKAGGSYSAVAPTVATAYIANSGAETFLVSTGAATMYRGMSNDFVTYTLTRWGDTNTSTAIPTSDLAMTGGAVYGTDYGAGPQPANFHAPATAGVGTSTIPVNPSDLAEYVEVGLPISHVSYTGSQSIILTATSGGGVAFLAGSSTATATLLDNLNPPENVVWSDALTASNSDSINWNVAFSQNTGNYPYQFFFPNYNGVPTQDYDANFGAWLPYDFVPAAPNGATNALRVTVNKLSSGGVGAGTSRAAGVNLYPNNSGMFAGNYAMRFSMNLVRGCADATATEYAVFGINHYGTNVNWVDGSGVQSNSPAGVFSFTNADGINFCIEADANQFGINGGSGDFFMFAASNYDAVKTYFPSSGYLPLPLPTSPGLSYSTYTNVFKNFGNAYDIADSDSGPDNGVYNAPNDQFAALNNAGVPANVSGWAPDPYSSGSCFPPGSQAVGPWTDVDIEQSNNVITMSLNKTLIYTYSNVTPFTNGYPMLGYFDPFDSLGNGGGVYYSNLRMLELGPQIVVNPVGVTVGPGTNVTLTVKALVNSTSYTNTWYLGGSTQVQQDTPGTVPNDIDTYMLPASVDDVPGTYAYTVVISDASGTVTSTSVNVVVQAPPVISTSIISPAGTIYYGATVIMTAATVSGTTPFTYSWTSNATTLANGNEYAGATTASLTITNVPVQSTTYTAKAVNTAGPGTSGVVLTVVASPQPNITNSAKSGNTVTLKWNNGGDSVNTTNSFTVQGSTNFAVNYVTNGNGIDQTKWTNVSPLPSFTVSGSNFTATFTNTVPYTNQQFFRIQHK